MFFVLSKILDFVFQPICWIFFLLGVSIIKLKSKSLKRLLGFALFILIILTNGFLTNLFYNSWEIPYQSTIEKKFKYGVVLTGGIMQASGVAQSDIHFGKQSDRLLQAYLMYKKGVIQKIIISGGSVSIKGALIRDEGRESLKSKEFLMIAGVPDSCVIVEGASRNTFENAKFTGELLNQLGEKSLPILLFTSSYHMKRSSACFHKQGIIHEVFPTTKIGKDASRGILNDWLPNEEYLFFNAELIHEIAGYFIYKFVGYC